MKPTLHPAVTAGAAPPSTAMLDRVITFGAPQPVVSWSTGEETRSGALIRVQTRPSALYSRLFVFPDFARSVRYVLFLVMIGFAIIELLALVDRHAPHPHRDRRGRSSLRGHATHQPRRIRPPRAGQIARSTLDSRQLVQLDGGVAAKADRRTEAKTTPGKRTGHRTGSAGATFSRARLRNCQRWNCTDFAVPRGPSAETTTTSCPLTRTNWCWQSAT